MISTRNRKILFCAYSTFLMFSVSLSFEGVRASALPDQSFFLRQLQETKARRMDPDAELKKLLKKEAGLALDDCISYLSRAQQDIDFTRSYSVLTLTVSLDRCMNRLEKTREKFSAYRNYPDLEIKSMVAEYTLPESVEKFRLAMEEFVLSHTNHITLDFSRSGKSERDYLKSVLKKICDIAGSDIEVRTDMNTDNDLEIAEQLQRSFYSDPDIEPENYLNYL